MSGEWFHGTRRGFGRGGFLTPASFHGAGQANRLDDYDGAEGYVFLTPDREVAEMFARSAKGRGRPKVLTVEPTADVEPDHATLGGEDGSLFRSSGWAKILKVEIIGEDGPRCSDD